MSEAKKVVKELGPETKLIAEYLNGKVTLSVDYNGKLVGANAAIHSELYQLVDAITDVIPGDWDDQFIDPLIKKLSAKKSAPQV